MSYPYYPPLNPDEIHQARKEAMEEFHKKITATPEASLKYLIEAGFIKEDGSGLTEYYQQPKQEEDEAKTYPKLPPLSPDTVDDYLALMKEGHEERMRTHGASRKFLIEAGILDPKGGLTQRYRDDEETPQTPPSQIEAHTVGSPIPPPNVETISKMMDYIEIQSMIA